MYRGTVGLRIDASRVAAARVLVAAGVALALLPGSPLRAQVGTRTASVNLTLAVVNGLTVLVDRPLDYGTVLQNSGSYSITPVSPNVGKVRVWADKSKAVTVTLTPSNGANLLHTDGTHTMSWTFGAAYNANADDGAAATPFPAPIPYTATFKPNVVVSGGSREAFLYLYGTINTNTAVATGLYRATVTVSIHY